jgi:hypothetical protein
MAYIGLPLGDTNEDGKIDGVDIARVAKYFGQNIPPAPDSCDVNLDGTIDGRDLAITCRHFGAYNTVRNSGFEDGMLGWAFHPGYKGSWGYPCGRAYRGKYGFCMGSNIEYGDSAFICSLSQKPLPATKNFLFTAAIDGDKLGAFEEFVIQPLRVNFYSTHGGAYGWVEGIGWFDFPLGYWFLFELRQMDDGRTIVYIDNNKVLEGQRTPITLDGIELILYAISEPTSHVEIGFDEVRVYRIV